MYDYNAAFRKNDARSKGIGGENCTVDLSRTNADDSITSCSYDGNLVLHEDKPFRYKDEAGAVSAQGIISSQNKTIVPKTAVGTLTKTDELAPTCMSYGHKAYWTDEEGNLFVDEKGTRQIEEPEIIPALGHDWGEPVYTWENDCDIPDIETHHYMCSAIRTCKRDDAHTESEYVIAAETIMTEAGCTTPGVKELKADFDKDWAEDQTIQIELPALGHDWGDWMVTKEATLTEDGEETRVCRNDASHIETRAIPKVDENARFTITFVDEDGTILQSSELRYGDTPVFSGVLPIRDGFSLVGHSISLDGDIAVNFYMELSDSVVAHRDTAYMHFTIPTGRTVTEQDILVKDARIVESDDKTYYAFKCRVAAKEMTSEIKAQIIDGDQHGIEYTYSVKEYADYLLEHAGEREDLARAVPLVKAMLNYGAYTQIYFDKNSSALANADLEKSEKILDNVTIDIADPVIGALPEGATFKGATLSLKSETTLSLYFKSSGELAFSCDGYTVETAKSGGYQIARIRGIKAKHLGDILTLKINGSEAVSYSPLNYCRNVLTAPTATPDEAQAENESLVNAVKALYWY